MFGSSCGNEFKTGSLVITRVKSPRKKKGAGTEKGGGVGRKRITGLQREVQSKIQGRKKWSAFRGSKKKSKKEKKRGRGGVLRAIGPVPEKKELFLEFLGGGGGVPNEPKNLQVRPTRK